jgi:hypothetical protein
VRDLLGDVAGRKSLKVREHRLLGPYVEVRYRLPRTVLPSCFGHTQPRVLPPASFGRSSRPCSPQGLTKLAVKDHATVLQLMEVGVGGGDEPFSSRYLPWPGLAWHGGSGGVVRGLPRRTGQAAGGR